MIAAARVSPLEREKIREKQLNIDFREYPLQYDEFKQKYIGILQHAWSFASQVQIKKFFTKCLENNDFDAINNFYSYMIFRREEQAILDSA